MALDPTGAAWRQSSPSSLKQNVGRTTRADVGITAN